MPVYVVAASVAAAVIHFALGPEHVRELGLLGWGFYVAGALQLGWAALVVVASRDRGAWRRRRVTRLVLSAGLAINVAILVAWSVSRVVGLPTAEGSWTREPIGASDSITAILELGVVIAIAMAWRPRDSSRRPAAAFDSAAGSDRGVPALVGAAPILGVILIATVTAIGTPHTHAGETHDGTGVEAIGQAHAH